MLILAIIVGYLLIGAIIGLKDVEIVNESIRESEVYFKDAPSWIRKLGLIIGVSGIILMAPMVELYLFGDRCMSVIKR